MPLLPSLPSSLRRLAAAATLSALAGFAPAAWSATPTEASIDTLLTVTRSQSLLETAHADLDKQLRAGLQASLRGREPTAQEQQTIDAIARDAAAMIREEMTWQKLRPAMVDIYRKTFSQEEIDGLTAFYRTPIGTAVIDKMPAVMQASVAAVQQQVIGLMPRLQDMVKKRIAESRPAAPTPTPAPSPAAK